MKINPTTGNKWFCVNGTWKTWSEMTPAEQIAKVATKLSIASASGDVDMEKFWGAVEVTS